ncbi:MAG: M48 family metallopeptidase [Thermodesulfobacteriota bacterium]|nr:M48 family metallopeptidase [Thermodesulfobacteriota bacterium]
MNPYLIFILTVLILGYLLNLVVAILELRSLDPELPPEFSDVYSREKYRQSQQYTRVNTRFSQIHDTFMLVVTITFILAGGFNQVDLMARAFDMGPIPTGLLFAGILALLSTIIGLPFSLYSTFVIEERFGFNKTTVKIFILDLVKSVILALCIGGPLLAAVLWFFQAAGNLAWLYCWLAVTVFILILQFLAPVLIMPLFNKFTPLEDGDLKNSITDYARAQQFAIKGIYTMDGSKRSTRLNAFFTGFGRFRRIVFFDTLVDKLNTGEIVSVLAHEMGHFKHKHIFKMMAASVLQMGIMFYILSLFLGNQQLFAAFGMEHISIYGSLFFFGFLYTPVSTLLSIFFNLFSRKHEYEADAWAVTSTGRVQELISGLKKLSVHNLSNLTPHPFNVFLNYSHPPVLQRIRAIEQLSKP